MCGRRASAQGGDRAKLVCLGLYGEHRKSRFKTLVLYTVAVCKYALNCSRMRPLLPAFASIEEECHYSTRAYNSWLRFLKAAFEGKNKRTS